MMTRCSRFIRSLLLSLAVALTPPLSAAPLEIGGHIKSLNLHIEPPEEGELSSAEVSSNRLRLDVQGRSPFNTTWEISTEGLALYRAPDEILALPADSPNRRLDLEKNWNEERHLALQLYIDRVLIKKEFAHLEATLGRQAIGFGRINLFSPLDIIAPFAPDALDTEVRPGVDALRLSRYFGINGQTQLLWVAGDTRRHNSYLFTVEGGVTGIDLLAIGGVLRSRPMIGGGIATQLAGAGIKAELAWYKGQKTGEIDGDLHSDFAIGALEAEYMFANDLAVFVEYLYNGAGVESPKNYPKAAASAPLQEGLAYLSGRHYLLLSSAYELHPLVNLGSLLIANLSDRSWLLRPLVNISLSDNMVLQGFWTFNAGDKPEMQPSLFGPLLLPQSEFGSVPDSGGLFFKFFF